MKHLIRSFNDGRWFRGSMSVWGGTIFYPCLDRWLYAWLHRWGWMGKREKALFDHLLQPGMRVLDIGGNIGLYAYYFSHKVGVQGHVTVLEPIPELIASIQAMAAANGLTQLTLLPFAAGDVDSEIILARDPLNSGNNFILTNPDQRLKTTLWQRRLDALLPNQSFDFIKIDIQGWEEKALLGLKNLLSQENKPLILIEISEASLSAAGSHSSRIVELLENLGYRLHLPRWEGGEIQLSLQTKEQVTKMAAVRRYFDLIAMAPACGPKSK